MSSSLSFPPSSSAPLPSGPCAPTSDESVERSEGSSFSASPMFDESSSSSSSLYTQQKSINHIKERLIKRNQDFTEDVAFHIF